MHDGAPLVPAEMLLSQAKLVQAAFGVSDETHKQTLLPLRSALHVKKVRWKISMIPNRDPQQFGSACLVLYAILIIPHLNQQVWCILTSWQNSQLSKHPYYRASAFKVRGPEIRVLLDQS